MALQRSFEKRVMRWCLAVAASCLMGCVTVRPEDKELLADPAMTYGSSGEEAAQEAHVLANREGALPGTATTGGGCGCN